MQRKLKVKIGILVTCPVLFPQQHLACVGGKCDNWLRQWPADAGNKCYHLLQLRAGRKDPVGMRSRNPAMCGRSSGGQL